MTLILALIGLLAGWVITGFETTDSQLVRASTSSMRQPSGVPQLVRMDSLPGMDGGMCEWAPASAGSALSASLWQQSGARRSYCCGNFHFDFLSLVIQYPPDEMHFFPY